MLQGAIKAVPALKYALGVLGIISAISISVGFGIDFRVAVFGTVIMLVLMTALVVFAALTKVRSPQLRAAALVLMWSLLTLTILSAALLFTSTFFNYPVKLSHLFGSPTPTKSNGTQPVTEPELLTRPGPDPEREGGLVKANQFLRMKARDFPGMQEVIDGDHIGDIMRRTTNGQFFCSDPIRAKRTDPTVLVNGIPTGHRSPVIWVYLFAPRGVGPATITGMTDEIRDGTATLNLKGEVAAGSVVFVVYSFDHAIDTLPFADRLEVRLQ